ncbi:MAG: VOC family protein [Archangiaceae bacterium]|nr:VOC family protein [Archangiaceae bacterium]
MPTPAKRFIPDAYATLTPYFAVSDAAAAIAFYVKAFGAREAYRLPMPNGKLGHAELRIGNCTLMLADEDPSFGNKSAKTLGGSPVGICLYVEDCDAVFARAVAAGATVQRPLADQFYGDRSGTLVDPFGQHWTISTHQVDLTPEELSAAMAKQAH